MFGLVCARQALPHLASVPLIGIPFPLMRFTCTSSCELTDKSEGGRGAGTETRRMGAGRTRKRKREKGRRKVKGKERGRRTTTRGGRGRRRRRRRILELAQCCFRYFDSVGLLAEQGQKGFEPSFQLDPSCQGRTAAEKYHARRRADDIKQIISFPARDTRTEFRQAEREKQRK
eukprot:220152-Hanusia_phi.AAC.1